MEYLLAEIAMKRDKKKPLREEELSSRIEIQQRLLQNYAKEIYENIGQVLSLAKMQLLSIKPEVNRNSDEIMESGNLVGKAIADLRSLTKQLTPEEIIKNGFANSFVMELERLSKTGLCVAEYSINGIITQIDQVKELVVFCILQQLIHPVVNIHDPGIVKLVINYKKTKIEIDIERGFKEESLLLNISELASMKERLKTVDANISYKNSEWKILHITINK
jgi:signal transduction histidine kinase